MYAAIDIGTNTVRLLIGKIEDGHVIPLRYERAITRLGGCRTPHQGLDRASMERTLAVLMTFAQAVEMSGCTTLRAVATEAVRSAVNGAQFVSSVSRRCGLDIDIVSGINEAQLSASGALSVIQPTPKHSLIIDIGGGSTELIYCHAKTVMLAKSYPIGAVGLYEIIDDAERRHRQALFAEELATDFAELKGGDDVTLIGTAGTITTVAAALMKMTEYDWKRVNNVRFSINQLNDFYEQLSLLSVVERENLPGVETGRGDILPVGIEILQAVFHAFAKTEMTVADFGLLEGLLLSMADRSPARSED
ncbi:MAG: hypothetical protein RQ724_04810 [Desulfuromonadales bacterium]|nr:hypothetical protein [Desulfuromonadales bacterium]